MFRELRKEEIEIRVHSITGKSITLLLYKTARADMDILDETVGALNWERTHSRDNANCSVSIWDTSKGMWVTKEDTGVESNTEKEKGLASDSFKRACTNWGIGRELYTSPTIRFPLFDKNGAENVQTTERGDKKITYDKFAIEEIKIENKVITGLTIRNDSLNKRVFTFSKNGRDTSETMHKQKEKIVKTDCKSQKKISDTQADNINQAILRVKKALNKSTKQIISQVETYIGKPLTEIERGEVVHALEYLNDLTRSKERKEKAETHDIYDNALNEWLGDDV